MDTSDIAPGFISAGLGKAENISSYNLPTAAEPRQIEDCWKDCSATGTDTRAFVLALPAKCWRSYWLSLYCLARKVGCSPQESEDLAQGFVLEFFARGYVDSYNPQLGQFRPFLCLTFKRFLLKHWRACRASKRGDGHVILSLEDPPFQGCRLVGVADHLTPEKAYERACLNELFLRARSDLVEMVRQRWDHTIAARLIPLATEGRTTDGYRELSRELHWSEDALKMAVSRLRQRFVGILREEIRRDCPDEEDTRREVRHLIGLLS